MRRPLRVLSLAFLQAGLIGGAAQAKTLVVGDPAPKLEVSRWVKGEKVDRFDPATTYVLEFWATWCEPCRQCMPHLTQLQKKYKAEATFIGVDVWEPDQEKVEPFVKKMAGKMDYRVALDEVPDTPKDGSRGKMAEAWLTAAGERAIPATFVVKDGRIAWIGHPMELDHVLSQVVTGTWDFEAAAKERQEKQSAQAQRNTILEKAQRLVDEHRPHEAIVVLDRAIAATPDWERQLGLMKVTVFAQTGDDDALIAYGSKLMGSVWKEDSDALNYLALVIISSERNGERPPSLLKVALQAAERANDLLDSQSGRILDTLARVCFASGDAVRAAHLEERALGLAEGDAPQWRERLERYRKAAASSKPSDRP